MPATAGIVLSGVTLTVVRLHRCASPSLSFFPAITAGHRSVVDLSGFAFYTASTRNQTLDLCCESFYIREKVVLSGEKWGKMGVRA